MQLHFLSAMSHARAVQLTLVRSQQSAFASADRSLLAAGQYIDVHLTGPAHQLLERRAECNPAAHSVRLCARSQTNALHSSIAESPHSCTSSAIDGIMTCPAQLATARGMTGLQFTARACGSTTSGRHSTSTSTLQPCAAALQLAAPGRQQRQRQVGHWQPLELLQLCTAAPCGAALCQL
jgi:hypothetical protein